MGWYAVGWIDNRFKRNVWHDEQQRGDYVPDCIWRMVCRYALGDL